jgi:hypothetical protein
MNYNYSVQMVGRIILLKLENIKSTVDQRQQIRVKRTEIFSSFQRAEQELINLCYRPEY